MRETCGDMRETSEDRRKTVGDMRETARDKREASGRHHERLATCKAPPPPTVLCTDVTGATPFEDVMTPPAL